MSSPEDPSGYIRQVPQLMIPTDVVAVGQVAGRLDGRLVADRVEPDRDRSTPAGTSHSTR